MAGMRFCQLELFEMKNAKCDDPNEEYRLRKVITDAVGIDRFETNIKKLSHQEYS